MKTFFVLAFLLAALTIQIKAQTPFIRVYNKQNVKIASGKFQGVAGDKLIIQKGAYRDTFAIKEISYLKTGHSGGHNIGLFSAAGMMTGMLLGTASADEDSFFSEGETIIYSTLGGMGVGVVVGLLSLPFKSTETIPIDGAIEKLYRWEEEYNNPDQVISEESSPLENYRKRKYAPYVK